MCQLHPVCVLWRQGICVSTVMVARNSTPLRYIRHTFLSFLELKMLRCPKYVYVRMNSWFSVHVVTARCHLVFYLHTQAVIRCCQVRTGCKYKGDVEKRAQSPLMNSRTVCTKRIAGPSCWNSICSTIPLKVNSGIIKFLKVSKNETPFTIASKKYKQITWLHLHLPK